MTPVSAGASLTCRHSRYPTFDFAGRFLLYVKSLFLGHSCTKYKRSTATLSNDGAKVLLYF